MNRLSQPTLDRIVGQTVSNKHIQGAVFHIASPDQSTALTSAAGNILPDGLYYIASINKLFLSALTLRLHRDGKLNLTDKIANYLPADTIRGLLVYKGRDYSNEITIAHLISHTSGLPCYLIDKRHKEPKVMQELLQGIDQEWPTDRVIAQVKRMQPKFRPGQKGKANYANTNFRLMGKVLEAVVQQPLTTILTNVFDELKLQNTFVLRPGEEKMFTPVYVKEKPIYIPRYLSSSGYDIISNAQDQMTFLKAFFEGYFYPKEKLPELGQWNDIFFPFKYGIGVQQFYTPRIFSPFKRIPHMIGHCGSTGTVAFYVPEKEVFITGAINQAKAPQALFQTVVRIINQL
jgi:CubicO group peptidase (beta-lactamase class C family)